MRLATGSVAALATVFLVACSGVKVTKDTGTSVDGIPFFAKTPVRIHETKLSQTDTSIEVVVTLLDEAGKVTRTDRLPFSGPRSIADTPDNRTKIDAIAAALSTPIPDESVDSFELRVVNLLAGLNAADPSRLPIDIVSNTWKVENVIGPQRYFIRNKIPAMGSAQAEFDLASDGTLTKVSSQAEDKMLSTVLSMIPVAGYLSHQWSLDKTTSSDEAKGLKLKARVVDGRPARIKISAALSVSRKSKTYTLQRVHCIVGSTDSALLAVLATVKDGKPVCDPLNYGPLALSDAWTGIDGVQIVGVTSDAAPAKDDAPAYGISGKITLPKSEAAGGG